MPAISATPSSPGPTPSPTERTRTMLPTPPGPLKLDELDVDSPSPSYSPLSSPGNSPKPLQQSQFPSSGAAANTPPQEAEAEDESTTDPGGIASSDSIALRSTLRLLMLQRERARRDIQHLAELREAALMEPLQFVDYIKATKNNKTPSPTALKGNMFADKELPKPQDVYRCPPVEWNKYQLLGAPLDAMHEAQRRRPQELPPARVPQSMHTGGIIGGGLEYKDTIAGDSGMMQGRMRLFDGIGCVGR